MAINILKTATDGLGLSIGIVQSCFNETISQKLAEVCQTELKRRGVQEDRITWVSVPGALEIPIVLQRLAMRKKFDVLLAIGAIIRGKTYHFEVVANQSSAAIMRVSIDYSIPVVNAILTTETEEQANHRIVEKGTYVARVAVEMGNLMQILDALDMDG